MVSRFLKLAHIQLRPDQTDQDSLPPYEVLDAMLVAQLHDGLKHYHHSSRQPARINPTGARSHGGAVRGGFPINRPDLHFLYNLVAYDARVALGGEQRLAMESWQAPRGVSLCAWR
jgi:hypothetical protein